MIGPVMSRRSLLRTVAGGSSAAPLAGPLSGDRPFRLASGPGCRAVIAILNVGGPSHVDLWDPKPSAPAEFRGPFGSISTSVPGLCLSELLPQHARIADRLAWVRSCHHEGPALHQVGWSLMHTGRYRRGTSWDWMGDAAAQTLGQHGALPAHVTLISSFGSASAASALGGPTRPLWAGVRGDGRRAATCLLGSAAGQGEQPRYPLVGWLSEAAARPATEARLRSALRGVRDERRGPLGRCDSVLGTACLAARRLVEAGVRFVTVLTSPGLDGQLTWDTHGSPPGLAVRQLRDAIAPVYDHAVAGLIEDLTQRGLLDQTLVCSLSEFGRSPRVNQCGGRDHWPECWTSWFAGGGVAGGRVIGRSDRCGARPAKQPVTPGEMLAAIQHRLGVKQCPAPGPR